MSFGAKVQQAAKIYDAYTDGKLHLYGVDKGKLYKSKGIVKTVTKLGHGVKTQVVSDDPLRRCQALLSGVLSAQGEEASARIDLKDFKKAADLAEELYERLKGDENFLAFIGNIEVNRKECLKRASLEELSTETEKPKSGEELGRAHERRERAFEDKLFTEHPQIFQESIRQIRLLCEAKLRFITKKLNELERDPFHEDFENLRELIERGIDELNQLVNDYPETLKMMGEHVRVRQNTFREIKTQRLLGQERKVERWQRQAIHDMGFYPELAAGFDRLLEAAKKDREDNIARLAEGKCLLNDTMQGIYIELTSLLASCDDSIDLEAAKFLCSVVMETAGTKNQQIHVDSFFIDFPMMQDQLTEGKVKRAYAQKQDAADAFSRLGRHYALRGDETVGDSMAFARGYQKRDRNTIWNKGGWRNVEMRDNLFLKGERVIGFLSPEGKKVECHEKLDLTSLGKLSREQVKKILLFFNEQSFSMRNIVGEGVPDDLEIEVAGKEPGILEAIDEIGFNKKQREDFLRLAATFSYNIFRKMDAAILALGQKEIPKGSPFNQLEISYRPDVEKVISLDPNQEIDYLTNSIVDGADQKEEMQERVREIRVERLFGRYRKIETWQKKTLDVINKNPDLAKNFDQFLQSVEEAREENIALLNRGSFLFEKKPVEIFFEGRMYMSSYDEAIQADCKSLYYNLMETAFTTNEQVNTDTFLVGLPFMEKALALGDKSRIERDIKLTSDWYKKMQGRVPHLKGALEFAKGMNVRQTRQLLEKGAWKNVRGQVFTYGERVITFMTRQGQKVEYSVPLDLSSLGAITYKQTQEIFSFLKQYSLMLKTEIGEKGIPFDKDEMPKLSGVTLNDEITGALERIGLKDTEAFLKIALQFSYRMYRKMDATMICLGQREVPRLELRGAMRISLNPDVMKLPSFPE